MGDLIIDASLQESDVIEVGLDTSEELSAELGDMMNTGGTLDYEKLRNKPQIDGTELIGNRNLYEQYPRVSEGDKDYWADHPTYVPLKNELVIYTNYYGTSPAVKVGDGEVPVVDLPFINGDITDSLIDHINDKTIHITADERLKWNDKITCDLDGETLIFSK